MLAWMIGGPFWVLAALVCIAVFGYILIALLERYWWTIPIAMGMAVLLWAALSVLKDLGL